MFTVDVEQQHNSNIGRKLICISAILSCSGEIIVLLPSKNCVVIAEEGLVRLSVEKEISIGLFIAESCKLVLARTSMNNCNALAH